MPSVNITTTAGPAFVVPNGLWGWRARNLSDTIVYWRDSQDVSTSGDTMGMPLDPGQEIVELFKKDNKQTRTIMMVHGASGNKQVVYDFVTVEMQGATGSPVAAEITVNPGTGALPTTDNGPAWTTVRGVSGVPFTSADQHSAAASVTDAPTSGQKLVIDDLLVSVDTAMSVTFKEETSGTVIHGPLYLPANYTGQITLRGKTKLPTANKKLQVITSVAGNISVEATYHSEA